WAHFNLSLVYRDLDRADEALPHACRAVELQPESAKFRCMQAQLLLDLDRPAEAERLLRQLVATDQQERAHILLVAALLKEGQQDEALRIARAGVVERQESPATWVALSRALRAGGDATAADDALARARALDDADPWVRSEEEEAPEEEVHSP